MPRVANPIRAAIRSLDKLNDELAASNRILTIDEIKELNELATCVGKLRDSYIYAAHKQGMPSTLIAEHFAISPSRVSQILKEQRELNE